MPAASAGDYADKDRCWRMPKAEITAIGTNSLAASNMLKAYLYLQEYDLGMPFYCMIDFSYGLGGKVLCIWQMH